MSLRLGLYNRKRNGALSNVRIIILVLIVFLVFLPFIIHVLFVPIQFHQFLIHRWEVRYGVWTFKTIFDSVVSAYSSGMNILSLQPIANVPRMNDRIAMFSYLFSWVPPYAIVYPTEGFYYLRAEDLNLDGNIRIADLDNGKLTFAVHSLDYTERYFFEVNESDGLAVKKVSDHLYYVAYHGKTVRFKLTSIDVTPPSSLNLLPEEEYVGHIFDESGIKFFLLFNRNTTSFYDLLDEENSVSDTLVPLYNGLFVGKRSGFTFYYDKDYERKILVGVNLSNIERNNYFDGPGDQVPYWLDLKEKLNIVYPNTLLDGGIDKHGVYLNETSWRRVAIMPFIRYEAFDELLVRYSLCAHKKTKSFLWTCLTKEPWNTPQWRQEVLEEVKAQEEKFK